MSTNLGIFEHLPEDVLHKIFKIHHSNKQKQVHLELKNKILPCEKKEILKRYLEIRYKNIYAVFSQSCISNIMHFNTFCFSLYKQYIYRLKKKAMYFKSLYDVGITYYGTSTLDMYTKIYDFLYDADEELSEDNCENVNKLEIEDWLNYLDYTYEVA